MNLTTRTHYQRMAELLAETDGTNITKLFVVLSNLGVRDQCGFMIMWSLFRQMCHQCARTFEKRVARGRDIQTIRGVKRTPNHTYDPESLPKVSRKPIWDPTNWRATERELGRYVQASVYDFDDTLDISVAGPDATKVGTDLGLNMVAFFNPTDEKTCVALPQVTHVMLLISTIT